MKRIGLTLLVAALLVVASFGFASADGGAGLRRSGNSQSNHGQQPVVRQGAITLTQSTSQDIVPLNSVSCNDGTGHTDNSYYRVFDLEGEFSITEDFEVTSVEFGVEEAAGAGGDQPISVILYTLDGSLALANLTEIGRTDTTIDDQSLTIFSVPVAATVLAGETLVVEVFTPEGQTEGNLFFIGSNPEPETGPSYLRAADCGITQPTDTAEVGFPDMNIVMNVIGDIAPPTAVSLATLEAPPESGLAGVALLAGTLGLAAAGYIVLRRRA